MRSGLAYLALTASFGDGRGGVLSQEELEVEDRPL